MGSSTIPSRFLLPRSNTTNWQTTTTTTRCLSLKNVGTAGCDEAFSSSNDGNTTTTVLLDSKNVAKPQKGRRRRGRRKEQEPREAQQNGGHIQKDQDLETGQKDSRLTSTSSTPGSTAENGTSICQIPLSLPRRLPCHPPLLWTHCGNIGTPVARHQKATTLDNKNQPESCFEIWSSSAINWLMWNEKVRKSWPMYCSVLQGPEGIGTVVFYLHYR